MVGTSNQSVPEDLPLIDVAIRHDFPWGSPQGVVASFQSAGHVRCLWTLTIFWGEKMTTVLLILWLYLRCKPGMVRALGAMSKTWKMASASLPIEAKNRQSKAVFHSQHNPPGPLATQRICNLWKMKTSKTWGSGDFRVWESVFLLAHFCFAGCFPSYPNSTYHPPTSLKIQHEAPSKPFFLIFPKLPKIIILCENSVQMFRSSTSP